MHTACRQGQTECVQQFSRTRSKATSSSAAASSSMMSFIDGWIVSLAIHSQPLAKIQQQFSLTSSHSACCGVGVLDSQASIVTATAWQFSSASSTTSAPAVSNNRPTFDCTASSRTTFCEFHGLDAHIVQETRFSVSPKTLARLSSRVRNLSSAKHCALLHEQKQIQV